MVGLGVLRFGLWLNYGFVMVCFGGCLGVVSTLVCVLLRIGVEFVQGWFGVIEGLLRLRSWSKEVWKPNFRQYGELKSKGGKSQRGEEKKREDQRKNEKKENAGARKGRKVAIHSVFPINRGSGGSNSRLAKAEGAEPSGQMKEHAVVVRSTFARQKAKILHIQSTSRVETAKRAHPCDAKHISKPKH